MRNLHDVVRHWARVDEGIARNSSHAVGCGLVHVDDFVGVIVDDGGVVVNHRRVVDVGHLGDVHDGVGHVDLIHVVAAHVVGGDEDFSRSQREPSYAATAAESDGEMKSSSAHKRN